MEQTPQKKEGWESELSAFIDSRRRSEFSWGTHDCCAFTAEAVRRMTGFDAMAQHAGYSTAIGAERVIHAAGGIERIPEIAGLARLEIVKLARRGDVVAVELDGRTSLGICCGELSAFAGKTGIAFRPTLSCVAAWRVE